jgi:hypothetical protein
VVVIVATMLVAAVETRFIAVVAVAYDTSKLIIMLGAAAQSLFDV